MIEENKAKMTARAQMVGNEQIRRVARYVNDELKDKRISLCECRCCFYLRSWLAGAAFTTGKCGECDQAFMHSSTATPPFCLTCAKKNSTCQRCGASLDYSDIESVPSGIGHMTRYGFKWDNIEVTRVCHDLKWGRIMTVKTPLQTLQIRVTKTGLIKLDAGVQKSKS